MKTIREIQDELLHMAPDFAKKVAPLYVELDWRWYNLNRIPTEKRILEALKSLIKSIKNTVSYEISTGGLTVGVDDEGYAFIKFEFSEYGDAPWR